MSKWHSDVLLSTSDWPPFYQPSTTLASAGGSRYLNITLEPPTNLQLQQLRRRRGFVVDKPSSRDRRASRDRYFRRIVQLLPAYLRILPGSLRTGSLFCERNYGCRASVAVAAMDITVPSPCRYLDGEVVRRRRQPRGATAPRTPEDLSSYPTMSSRLVIVPAETASARSTLRNVRSRDASRATSSGSFSIGVAPGP